MNTTLIAPCGMNCGICLSYLREKNRCNGCWGDNTLKPNQCTDCIIRNCKLLEKTDSKFCYDCPDYPCQRLKRLDKRYRLKYHMSMLENLVYIKSSGVDKFVAMELTRWACKNCGGTICVHHGYCLNCKKTMAGD